MHESERAWLRAEWVLAVEESLALEDPHQFMRWMDRHVRPILAYQSVLCATGSFQPQSMSADRVLVRGVSRTTLDALRNEVGVIVLPYEPGHVRGPLRPIVKGKGLGALGIVAGLDPGEGAPRQGCYFLFARLRAVPDERQRFLAEILAPHMRSALTRCLAHEPTLSLHLPEQAALTRRELELLQWLVAGRTTIDIARSTFRSTHTISNQVRAILRKLSAANRTEAIAMALALGLVPPLEQHAQTRVMAAQTRAEYHAPRRRGKGRKQRATQVFRVDT